MSALRSIQPPDPQKAPMLSLTLETATFGALPPRMAATVLSSLMPPTLFTLIAGWVFWKSAITPLKTFCSRCVKGCQIVMVTGLLGSNCAGAAVVFAPPLSPPPQAPSSAAAQVSTARLARFRRRILSPISLETLPKLTRTVRLGRSAVKRLVKVLSHPVLSPRDVAARARDPFAGRDACCGRRRQRAHVGRGALAEGRLAPGGGAAAGP